MSGKRFTTETQRHGVKTARCHVILNESNFCHSERSENLLFIAAREETVN